MRAISTHVRIHEGTIRKLKLEAKRNKRSVNREMVLRIENSFSDNDLDARIEATMTKVLGKLLEVTVTRKETH